MKNNAITAVPVGAEYRLITKEHRVSTNIMDFSYDPSGLRVVVGTTPRGSFANLNLEYLFPHLAGFRFLDEFSLYTFWSCEVFASDHHLYEIKSGGWLAQEIQCSEAEKVPNSLGHNEYLREFFIKTDNWSANIISTEEPLIRELR